MNLLKQFFLLVLFLSFSSSLFAETDKIKDVFDLINQKNWEECESLSKNYKILYKIVQSQKFLDDSYLLVSYEEIVQFLFNNSRWPQFTLLRIRAENLLNDNSDQQLIIKWFEKYRPLTAKGYKFYALAAANTIKDYNLLIKIIKQGWIFGEFDSLQEKQHYYKKFNQFLSHEDHIKKIEHLILNNDFNEAIDCFSLVSDKYKTLFEAQIALIKKSDNALYLYGKVLKQYQTNSLIYHYLNYCKNNPPSAKKILSLIKLVDFSREKDDRFLKIQMYIMREFITKQNYYDAYKIASSYHAISRLGVSQIEFLSGWIALRFLNKPSLAIKHFEKFNKVVTTPISKSRGLYWLGRAYNALGDKEKSYSLFFEAATKYPYLFYGQVAAAVELNFKRIPFFPETTFVNLAKDQVDSYINNNEIVQAAIIVSKYGDSKLGAIYLQAVIEQAKLNHQVLSIIYNILNHDNVYHKVVCAQQALQKNIFIAKEHSYPIPYQDFEINVESALMYSIIRNESQFNNDAKSIAGALGLMQLIENTALNTAKTINSVFDVNWLISNPKFNVKIGTYHLKHLLQALKGSYILTIASYNASISHVERWLKLYGDPRIMNDAHQVIDWIESIPFYETRNYVQRVLESLQVYRMILNNNDKLTIKEELLSRKD